MTDAATESTTLTEVLVRHGIYAHRGVPLIAVDDFTLQALTGTDTVQVSLSDVDLIEEPGSPAWVDRMARLRTGVVRRLNTAENDLQNREAHFQALGEAILAEAEKREWCEEYDAFAQEWGLPTRIKEWAVTIEVRVKGRSEEAALDFVRGQVDLNSDYYEDIVSTAEFSAYEV